MADEDETPRSQSTHGDEAKDGGEGKRAEPTAAELRKARGGRGGGGGGGGGNR